jgi:hypothetical protein
MTQHRRVGGTPAVIDPNDQLTKSWVETWGRAGRLLEAIRRQELRSYVYEEHIQEIDELLDIAYRFRQTHKTSGLVEQQRLFQKWRHERDL